MLMLTRDKTMPARNNPTGPTQALRHLRPSHPTASKPVEIKSLRDSAAIPTYLYEYISDTRTSPIFQVSKTMSCLQIWKVLSQTDDRTLEGGVACRRDSVL